jgi:hypothetical protein
VLCERRRSNLLESRVRWYLGMEVCDQDCAIKRFTKEVERSKQVDPLGLWEQIQGVMRMFKQVTEFVRCCY